LRVLRNDIISTKLVGHLEENDRTFSPGIKKCCQVEQLTTGLADICLGQSRIKVTRGLQHINSAGLQVKNTLEQSEQLLNHKFCGHPCDCH